MTEEERSEVRGCDQAIEQSEDAGYLGSIDEIEVGEACRGGKESRDRVIAGTERSMEVQAGEVGKEGERFRTGFLVKSNRFYRSPNV